MIPGALEAGGPSWGWEGDSDDDWDGAVLTLLALAIVAATALALHWFGSGQDQEVAGPASTAQGIQPACAGEARLALHPESKVSGGGKGQRPGQGKPDPARCGQGSPATGARSPRPPGVRSLATAGVPLKTPGEKASSGTSGNTTPGASRGEGTEPPRPDAALLGKGKAQAAPAPLLIHFTLRSPGGEAEGQAQAGGAGAKGSAGRASVHTEQLDIRRWLPGLGPPGSLGRGRSGRRRRMDTRSGDRTGRPPKPDPLRLGAAVSVWDAVDAASAAAQDADARSPRLGSLQPASAQGAAPQPSPAARAAQPEPGADGSERGRRESSPEPVPAGAPGLGAAAGEDRLSGAPAAPAPAPAVICTPSVGRAPGSASLPPEGPLRGCPPTQVPAEARGARQAGAVDPRDCSGPGWPEESGRHHVGEGSLSQQGQGREPAASLPATQGGHLRTLDRAGRSPAPSPSYPAMARPRRPEQGPPSVAAADSRAGPPPAAHTPLSSNSLPHEINQGPSEDENLTAAPAPSLAPVSASTSARTAVQALSASAFPVIAPAADPRTASASTSSPSPTLPSAPASTSSPSLTLPSAPASTASPSPTLPSAPAAAASPSPTLPSAPAATASPSPTLPSAPAAAASPSPTLPSAPAAAASPSPTLPSAPAATASPSPTLPSAPAATASPSPTMPSAPAATASPSPTLPSAPAATASPSPTMPSALAPAPAPASGSRPASREPRMGIRKGYPEGQISTSWGNLIAMVLRSHPFPRQESAQGGTDPVGPGTSTPSKERWSGSCSEEATPSLQDRHSSSAGMAMQAGTRGLAKPAYQSQPVSFETNGAPAPSPLPGPRGDETKEKSLDSLPPVAEPGAPSQPSVETQPGPVSSLGRGDPQPVPRPRKRSMCEIALSSEQVVSQEAPEQRQGQVPKEGASPMGSKGGILTEKQRETKKLMVFLQKPGSWGVVQGPRKPRTRALEPAAEAALWPRRLDLGSCLEVLAFAQQHGKPGLAQETYTLMSNNLLRVLGDPHLYRQLSGADRERILSLRTGQGQAVLGVLVLPSLYQVCRSGLPRGSRGAEALAARPVALPPRTHLHVFNPQENTWRPLTQVPEEAPLRGCGLCTMHNYLFLAGGIRGSGAEAVCSSEVFCYNPLTNIWSQVRPMQQARAQLKLVALDGLLYAIGGECLYSMERYDPRTDAWTLRAPLPAGTFPVAHEAVACRGDIYVTGGHLFYRLLRYSPMKDSWEECPYSASHRRSSDMVALGGFLYRFDLLRGVGAAVMRYNTVTGSWSRAASLPLPDPAPLRCTVLGNTIYCLNHQVTATFTVSEGTAQFQAKELQPFPLGSQGVLCPFILTLPPEARLQTSL